MKNLLILLAFFALSNNLFAQNIQSLRNTLDSIQNQKAFLEEELATINKLETDYKKIISEAQLQSEVGKFFTTTWGTNMYESPYLTGVVSKLNKGDIVKLISYEDGHHFVEFNGKRGYVSDISIKLLKENSEETIDQPTTSNLLPISDGEIVEHSYYTLSYSEENEQPSWVYYKLTERMLGGVASRTDNFREDSFVKTGSATLADYKGSGYDRGHLCPAGDMVVSTAAMSESFYLSNMSPQDPSFNRGIWKSLEESVRNWSASEDEIYVVTGPIFKDNLGTIGNGVTIPGYYYKVIYDPTYDQKMIALVLPNRKGEKKLQDYVVTVDYVEDITGIDFFSGLPDELENELESKSDKSLWDFDAYNTTSSGGNSVQCKGIAKSTGQRCKNHTTNGNGYCYLHQDQAPGGEKKELERLTTSVQCKGTTKAGARCKNKTLNANGYCHLHQSQAGSSSPTSTKTSTTKSSYSGGRTIHTGPRGGKYYINSKGNKVYIK